MKIGSYNTFEVGCYIDTSEIGDMNEFGVKSSVLAGSLIGNGCTVNPLVQVPKKSRVENNSVFIDQGVISIDNQPRQESKKQQMKEVSLLLSSTLP